MRAEEIRIQTVAPDGWTYESKNGDSGKKHSEGEKRSTKEKDRSAKKRGHSKKGKSAKTNDAGKHKRSSDNPSTDARVKVWIVQEGPTDTPGGHSGERTRLKTGDFDVEQQNGTLDLVIDDVTETRFGQYMASKHRLEVEIKLSKDKAGQSYSYESRVEVVTRSPIDVYAIQSSQASIDVSKPGNGNSANGLGNNNTRIDNPPEPPSGYLGYRTAPKVGN